MSIAVLTAVELGRRFREGSLSPVDVVNESLARIEQNKDLNVFVVQAEADSIRAQARASENRWSEQKPLGPLDGVPLTVKDAIITEQWPTLMGSRAIDATRSLREDAPAVARVREQGAIILGKTTTPEFGWKALCDAPLTGITRSPWNKEVTPGGSSGGSAAALAAGIGHVAIGTDAGGSVRIPGAFCGLVALKATRGRIPAYPPSALWTLGHIGPMCLDVADTAMMLGIMAEFDPRDWNAAQPDKSLAEWQPNDSVLKGMRIAYSPTFGYGRVEPEISASVDAAAKLFETLGAHVELMDAPFPDPTPSFRVLFAAGLAHSVRHLNGEQRTLLDPGLNEMVAFGETVDRRTFMEANETSMTLARQMRLFHQKYPLLLSPTVAVPPFAAGRLSPDGYDQSDWLSWSPFTYPFNMTGQPALSIPCGLTSNRLPVGLQIVGAPYSEKLLLAAAHAFERISPGIGRAFA